MDINDLNKRIEKCSFVLKTLICKWNSLGESAKNTTTYKMVNEALDMLEGRFHEQVIINATIDDKTFLEIAKMAHEKDITFNQMVCLALREQLDRDIQKEKENETTDTQDQDM